MHLRIDPPEVHVLKDLISVTVASYTFGTAIALCTYALYVLGSRVPRRAHTLILSSLAILAAIFPFWLNAHAVNKHMMVYFSTASHGVLIFFKTVEALMGTTPPGLERSLWAWVVYYACDAEMRFPKGCAGPAPSPPFATWAPKLYVHMVGYAIANLLLLQFASLYDWRPFAPSLGFAGAVLDVYVWAMLLWTCAEWVIALARMVVHACGFDTIPAFRLPLLRSTSPRDFWSKRWNSARPPARPGGAARLVGALSHPPLIRSPSLVFSTARLLPTHPRLPTRPPPPWCAAARLAVINHKLMHRTYFLPVLRRFGSSTVGALSAFLASAIFHAYM
jgi:hypothetical protein